MITNTSKKEYIKMTNVASKNQHLLLSSVCGFVLFSLFGPDGFKIIKNNSYGDNNSNSAYN